MTPDRAQRMLTPLAAAAGVGALLFLLTAGPGRTVTPRLPDRATMERRKAPAATESRNPGMLTPGPGQPGPDVGAWPQFRGPNRNGKRSEADGLYVEWPEAGPEELWRVEVGEGHAGPVVHAGRVYVLDYDREAEEDALRCLSLADGREIWRYSYSVSVKRNHGMSRTVPAVSDGLVVSLGPKCDVLCVAADSGEKQWALDLVEAYGTVVPPWYAGQCPLIEDGRLILAPGAEPLMVALDAVSGEEIWRTPNPGDDGMTHSSIVALPHPSGRQYVYCTTRGVVGVRASDGALLWRFPEWKISIANVPSPVVLDERTLLFSGGYNAGAAVVRVEESDEGFAVTELHRVGPRVFGSDQHTPVLRNGVVWGVLPGPKDSLGCFDPESGRLVWTGEPADRFGLGPYLLADDLLYVLQDQKCELSLYRLQDGGAERLARAAVLDGHDAWAPMALAGGRLLLRDLTQLVCLRVGDDNGRTP